MWSLAAVILATVPGVDADELPPAPAQSAEAQPAPRRPINLFSLLPPDRRAAALRARHARGGSLAALLERVSRGLVGAPYLLSPLGEGRAPDFDPRFRIDAFDCTTFVETAIALGYCDDWADAEALLDRIRYTDGTVAFHRRRHLIVAQWIPELTAEGYLRDVTAEVGGQDTKTARLSLTEARWKRRRIARTLTLPASRVPIGEYTVPIIPIEAMLERVDRVPPGTVLSVVRLDVPWSPVRVTHQGLVIVPPGEKIRMVRHASPVSKRVVDETLEHMMRRYLKPRKWKVVGVNLQQIVDPLEAR